MNRALQAVAASCAAFALMGAASSEAAPVGTLSFTAYASQPDPQGGFDYLRLFPDNVVIAHLDHALLSATFVNEDYSKEYAIEDDGSLVTVDTGNGAVTQIGGSVTFPWTHVSITTDPDSSVSYLLVAESPCTSSSLFAIDRTSGVTTLIGGYDGCLQSMVMSPDGNHIYALDRDVGALATLDNGVVDIGSLGFTLDDADTLVFIPGSSNLYLFAFDPDAGTNVFCLVDTTTGHATLIGPTGGDMPITGVVAGGALPDAMFANGFED
jgi:hypothetical protein